MISISFRPAHSEDFDYCAKLYFAGWKKAIREPDMDITAQIDNLRQRWDVKQVRIITSDGADIGWLQSAMQDDALFIVQFFIDAPFQRKGIGTDIMHRIIHEARTLGKAVTLGVVKTSPALRLYTRLGFQTTHEDERKFYMRRNLTH